MGIEKTKEISNQIVEAYLRNRTAGDIAINSLDKYDDLIKEGILVGIYQDKRLPEEIRTSLYDRITKVYPTHRVPFDKNLPVCQLLKYCNDKKSGKIAIAVKQLKERFMHLEYNEQIMVMKAFMSKTVSYRKWCYNILLKWREPLFDDTLIEHWKKYEDYDCLVTITEKLSSEKIKAIYPLIRQRHDIYIYSRLLQRFGHEEWIDIDKELLKKKSHHPFYYVLTMSKTRQTISKEECLELLYYLLQDDFSPDYIEELWKNNEQYEDEYGYRPPLCYRFEGIKLKMPNNSILPIHSFLKVFAQMGYYDLVASLMNWGDSVNQHLQAIELPDESNEEEVRAICKERFKEYITLLRNEMPLEFMGINEFPDYDISSIKHSHDTIGIKSDPIVQELTNALDLEILTPF